MAQMQVTELEMAALEMLHTCPMQQGKDLMLHLEQELPLTSAAFQHCTQSGGHPFQGFAIHGVLKAKCLQPACAETLERIDTCKAPAIAPDIWRAPAGRTNASSCDVPVRQQQHVVKEGVHLRRRLQQAYHGGQAQHTRGVAQELDHAVGGGAVQPGADLIHQQHALHSTTPAAVMCKLDCAGRDKADTTAGPGAH